MHSALTIYEKMFIFCRNQQFYKTQFFIGVGCFCFLKLHVNFPSFLSAEELANLRETAAGIWVVLFAAEGVKCEP